MSDYTTNVTIEDDEDLRVLASQATESKFTYENWQADNNRRAGRAAVAVLAYAGSERGEPVETVISDLLADLRHLCDAVVDENGARGVDFDFILDRARRNYGAEIQGVL